MRANIHDKTRSDDGSSKEKSSTSSRPTRASPSPAASSEREALLSRTTLSKTGRPQSGSYGSKLSDAGKVAAPPVRRNTIYGPDDSPVQYPSKSSSRPGSRVATPLLKKPAKQERKQKPAASAEDGTTLVIAFVVMILVGTGNRVFMKLQTYPMYNYPFFLTMLSTFIYVPVCFIYIIPMLMFGSSITPEQRAIPKVKFLVMGLLDSIAGIMGVFAVNYINNAAMIVLLQQAAIPISMSISKFFLGAKYTISQYIGASVVIAGIIVTLIPTFFGHPSGGDDANATTQIMWSGVQVLSCIPMCLSSVYKEKALGDDDLDVIYLNGWVAVFQLASSLLFAVPSAYAMGLPVSELPRNTYEGYLCFMGQDSHFAPLADLAAGMSMPPDHCESAPLLVSLYLCFNLVYNVVLIVILKYGSANVLFLASTVMVPIGNVAFSLKFVPHHQDLRPSDTMGLLFILTGLVIYRFSGSFLTYCNGAKRASPPDHENEIRAGKKMSRFVGINQLEYLEPLMQMRVSRAQKARLLRSPETIRSAFMHRLGLPPSPTVSATQTARVTSPYIGRSAPRGIGNPRASPAGYRVSPGGYRASPGGYRASPGGYRAASPGAFRSSPGYQPIPEANQTVVAGSVDRSRKTFLSSRQNQA